VAFVVVCNNSPSVYTAPLPAIEFEAIKNN